MTDWDACADPTLRLEDFAGAPCWMGVDLARRDDMAAVALLFERADVLYAFVKFYLPRDVVARAGAHGAGVSGVGAAAGFSS